MGRWWRYKWITFHPSLTAGTVIRLAPIFHSGLCAFSLCISPDFINPRRAAFSISHGGNKGVYKRCAPLYFLHASCSLPFAAQ
ncbi:hypothetical protein DY705_23665 [Salmonella enterica]|nr:hypothetical protein [Salmonella enterica]